MRGTVWGTRTKASAARPGRTEAIQRTTVKLYLMETPSCASFVYTIYLTPERFSHILPMVCGLKVRKARVKRSDTGVVGP